MPAPLRQLSCFTWVSILVFFTARCQTEHNDEKHYSVDDFSIPLEQLLHPQNHLWVTSGSTTVNPKHNTVFGVGDFFAPPLGVRDFELNVSLAVDDHIIRDDGSHGKGDVGLLYAGGSWNLDNITRRGTYNHKVDGRHISIGVESKLVPMVLRNGFVEQIVITNRSNENIEIQVLPQVNAGAPAFKDLGSWTFSRRMQGTKAKKIDENEWGNDQAKIRLSYSRLELDLAPGGTDTLHIAVNLAKANGNYSQPDEFPKVLNQTKTAWQQRVARYTAALPRLESNIPGLEDYYLRSIASGLVCIWENPRFIHSPFIATLGIDGGGICTYAWDTGGYVPQILTLMLGEDVKKILNAFDQIDLTQDYAYTPDGSGTGPNYAYSPWSYISLQWAIARHLGLNLKSFDRAVELLEYTEKFYPNKEALLDYGTQHNLLEMRGKGWEHIVASPNAERAWCYERLADMGENLGHDKGEIEKWRSQAKKIREAVVTELWDEKKKWFKALYPDNQVEYVYSIQVYDAYRAQEFIPEIEKELLSHLREGAFLGKYGVSSVSAQDQVHYELNDFDWSGGGAYTGEGPQLALILYERNQPQLAWDVLNRHFWMGEHLAYYPQEHDAHKPSIPDHKRANEIAGLAAAEAIIYGMAGFAPQIDGTVLCHPHPPEAGNISLRGLGFKGHEIDIFMRPGYCRILVNGQEVYQGSPKQIRIL